MKTIRKAMLGASVAALAVVAVSGVKADAATIDKTKAISGLVAGDSVSFDAVKVKSGKLEYNLNAKWDLYEEAGSADLSNVKTAKDSYFVVKGSTTTVYKVLADTQKKFQATCDGNAITITVDGKEIKSTDTDYTKFSWRTENSTWTPFTSAGLKLTPYTMQGATIYIRYMGNTTVTPVASTTEKVTVDGTELTVQEIPANSFPAKEFKVKVPKRANAPAISVDYANGVIKANKKAVYKTAATTAAALSGAWSTAAMTENFTIDNSAAGTFMMQIPADTAKKKPASKIGFFSWPMTSAPTVSYTAASVTATVKTGTLITNQLTYEAKDNAKVEKASFVIKNTSDKDATGGEKTYEIFKATTKDGKTVADGKAVATVKPGKEVALTAKKVSKDTELIIRVAGDKKTGKLPTPFATTKVTPVYLETPAAS